MSASTVIIPKSFCFIPQLDDVYGVAFVLSVSNQSAGNLTATVRELSKATLLRIATDNRDFLNGE